MGLQQTIFLCYNVLRLSFDQDAASACINNHIALFFTPRCSFNIILLWFSFPDILSLSDTFDEHGLLKVRDEPAAASKEPSPSKSRIMSNASLAPTE